MDWVIAVGLGVAMAFVFWVMVVLEILPSSVLGELRLPPEAEQKPQPIGQNSAKSAPKRVVIRVQ